MWRLKLCGCFVNLKDFQQYLKFSQSKLMFGFKKAHLGFIKTPCEVFVKVLRDLKDF